MRRTAGVSLLVVTLVGTPLHASAADRAASAVGGSWVNGVSCVPTSFDPDTGAIRCLGSSTWQGAWTGVTVYEVQAVSDVKSGDWTGTITETFTGTYTSDHSRGSLDFVESLSVDGASGAVLIEAKIVGGAGDPTFRCSSGQATFDGLTSPGNLVAFGGWHGHWTHGCAVD